MTGRVKNQKNLTLIASNWNFIYVLDISTLATHVNSNKNYEWQRNYGGNWDGVATFLNEDIERSFCDPANSTYMYVQSNQVFDWSLFLTKQLTKFSQVVSTQTGKEHFNFLKLLWKSNF